ncbi:C10 family peptidase [Prevotella sp. tf2-5]|uniref:C10 family peptidase n=1 Tax=Prevotella sp. tf2-5 TaxID=1761889 RepID=UPI0008F2F1A2|nr:C10 family peptidase [Prevotella sp. tf2-5]SFO50419.1 Spi protease inhibitor [Prevotella sp. tf2-5]
MRRLLCSLVLTIISMVMMAGNVTEQQALTIARQFMQGKSFQQKQVRRAAAVGDNQFYVFNAEGQNGFVIVSADDRTTPVLGYADKGSLEMNKLPVNARRWLEGYAEEIKALGEDVQANTHPRRVIGAPVAPLLTCHWDQGAPYNLQCPIDGEYNSVTGCVATAMAQVMYYHKWPQSATTAIPAYTTSTKKLSLSELPATTFKWDQMNDSYSYDETGAAADAVAELMRYCGQAVRMDYTSNESGASVGAAHLINYFGYSKTAQNMNRSYYTTTEWEAMIYKELSNARPVLYSGNSGSGGHQFVIDGYDDKGLFHVNWGWGGYADGHFVLSVLNPDGRGIGGGSSSNGYTRWQAAIIGVQPDHGEPAAKPDIFFMSQYDTYQFTRSGSTQDFTDVAVTGWIGFWGEGSVTVDHAWALYKGDNFLKILDTKADITINEGYFSYAGGNLSFGANLDNGIYELRELYRYPGETEWKKCGLYNDNILLAEISGNNLTLKYSSDIEKAIKINEVTVNGVKKTGRNMSAVINWTNNGYVNENPFYVWLGSDSEFAAAVSSYLESGKTEDLEIAFTSKNAGTLTLAISTDYDKQNIVYQTEITIEQSLPQSLETSMTIEGEKNMTIEGTTINATFTFKNTGNNVYDDLIVFQLQHIDDDWNYIGDPVEVVKNINLAAGEQTQVNVQFPDLIAGEKYYLVAYYFSSGFIYWGNSTTCTVGKVLVPADLSFSLNVTNTKSDYTIEGTSIKTNVVLKNNSTYDYNDKIEVTAYYDGFNGYIYPEKTVTITDVQIPAGQQKTLYNVEIPNLTIGRSYFLSVTYYSEGGGVLNFDWDNEYTLVTPTAINTVKTDQRMDTPAYNLSGQRVSANHKGIIIKNGKKYVVK